MPAYKRTLFVVVVVLAAAVSTAVSALRRGDLPDPGGGQQSRHERQEAGEDNAPTVDFDSPESSDQEERAKRQRKSAKYDDSVLVRKDDAAGGAVESTYVSEWEVGLPALPVGESEVVIVGEVLEARAHLSNDKTGVYSEFPTRIEKLFKTGGPVALAPGEIISLERLGGAVRYSTGRRYRYRLSGQNMPRKGRRYVFFLKAAEAEEGFPIVTAYELRGGKVFPLDSAEQFEAYRGVGEAGFTSAVQGAVGRNQD